MLATLILIIVAVVFVPIAVFVIGRYIEKKFK